MGNDSKRPLVMIVDDEPNNVLLLDDTVAPMGVDTCAAYGGLQALEKAKKEPVDVILLDIRMPDIDGVSVCRQLKENRLTREIPVIFITAFDEVETEASAIEAGGIGFITKPVKDILVRASVKNAIRIKELSDEVRDLVKQRQFLTGVIVHDINNLLSNVVTVAELLLLREGFSPKERKNLVRIERAGDEIHVLADNISFIEKIESGAYAMKQEVIDGWGVVKERAGRFFTYAEEKNVRIVMDQPSAEAKILADRVLLQKIIDNLILNALKFCPDKGLIKMYSTGDGSHWRFFIENDGPPIPEEYHQNIFEKLTFYEVRKKTGLAALGLALPFCRIALEAMNGEILVLSPLAGRQDGACFTAVLPCRQG